jgi:enoyl-CoA hydratase
VAVERDPEIRVVVVVSAAEKAFAAGADIREMADMGPNEAQRHGAQGQALTRQIERLTVPVIAAVHGACFGGGCELVQACDFVFASEDASFGQPEVDLGIMPGWGGTQRLPRRIPPMEARAWIFTGQRVSASEAARLGLVFRVVSRSALLEETMRFANELATKSSLALAASKYALHRAVDPDIDARLAYELALWKRLFGSPDQRVGMRAFLEKRPFVASGRHRWAEVSGDFPWAEEVLRRRHRPSARRRRTTPNSKR